MKSIYVITENNEVITARDSMNNAVAAAMNRLAICGYLCEGFEYDESLTIIDYRDTGAHETRTMLIQETNLREGV
jgi:hypothetical protein